MESLYEAWERYKDLLRKCPHHGLPVWMQVQTFYNGLLPNTQAMVDAASGGAINNKTLEEAYDLIKVMASNNYMKASDRSFPRKSVGVHEVDGFTALSAQLASIQKQLGSLNVNAINSPTLICTNLVLNWEKCHFMVPDGIVLGHRISANGIGVDRAKIEVIEKLPPPTSVKTI
ncbi:hypothetical protein MRB53_013742 [Persea americana]|uniref:Uncharacterized protein n=1 Tax=Persea americana TaxID=3435 RepID=A0ACC2K976_PERAE|nr:hypothetical protein MRB53_013742 [Persea americana]